MKKSILLVLLIAMLVGVFAACGGGSALNGVWYEETGMAGTIEFKDGGKCTLEMMGLDIDGTYEFDAKSGEGELTMEFMGQEETADFELDGEKLNMEGAIYTKDKVEQMDMEDMFGEMGDALDDIDLSDIDLSELE